MESTRQYIRTKDGSLVDNDGNVLYFSLERFIRDVCDGNHCFICGASPENVKFNDEHIVPRWILRKLDLFNEQITLPTGQKIRYGSYTLPCCAECNSFLGKTFEEPISAAVDGGLEGVNKLVEGPGGWTVFLWLALIFLKTHLKDTLLRIDLDRRKRDDRIASAYDWGLMHHIHALARARQVGATIADDVFGTLAVLPAKVDDHLFEFDYRDVYEANTVLLRVGDVAFVAVLDDSCACAHFFSDHFNRITGPLSPLQLREVLSHLTLLNAKLKYRPKYTTKLDRADGSMQIVAKLPESMELEDHTPEEIGEILYANVAEYVERMQTPDENFTEENVRRGMYHFLFDENGKFITNSMDRITEPPDEPSAEKKE